MARPAQAPVTFYPPDVTVNFPEQPATQVYVTNEVPVPVVNMSVAAPDVTVEAPVSVSVEPTPLEVRNTINVEPTPLEIKTTTHVAPVQVNLPKAVKETQTVQRDADKNITGTVTNIEYEE